MSLVDTDWLEKNINQVKIIDCSWHMPGENRNAEEEFNNEHIPNAVFLGEMLDFLLGGFIPHCPRAKHVATNPTSNPIPLDCISFISLNLYTKLNIGFFFKHKCSFWRFDCFAF